MSANWHSEQSCMCELYLRTVYCSTQFCLKRISNEAPRTLKDNLSAHILLPYSPDMSETILTPHIGVPSDKLGIEKASVQHVEDYDGGSEKRDASRPPMMTRLDGMGIGRAALLYKRILLVCMLAGFSASLDGYRKHSPASSRIAALLKSAEINLNGSIISNIGE
jgi:hypothetical protein